MQQDEKKNIQKQENHNDVVKPGSNKEEHKKIMKDTMNKALDEHRKTPEPQEKSPEKVREESDRAGKYETPSQGKSDADEETDALKNKKQ